MKTLYLDIFSGISGDMFIGALIDLGVDPQALENELKKLSLEGYHAHWSRKQKSGIEGVKFDVHLTDAHAHDHGPQGHSHGHSHSHPHTHSHSHNILTATFRASDAGGAQAHDHSHEHAHGRNFAEIQDLIRRSSLSDWVKEKSIAVFQRIAAAEGKIHGHPPEQVHFHEVGAVDSIVDILGACISLEMLGRPRVVSSPVVEGTGWVKCAHGRFPVPTPATLAILGARGVALSQCEEPHELITPTGAALLAEFSEEFGPMRNLVAEKIGFGLGTRDNQTRPNVVRAILGTVVVSGEPSDVQPRDWEIDTVAVLETNLDDINSEILGHFLDKALKAGALDVFHTPIQMKKNRPAVLLTLLCAEGDADRLSELILRETSAFGVRRHLADRRKLRREFQTVQTRFGPVTVKVGRLNGNVIQAAPEYESCRQAAETSGFPLKTVFEDACRAAQTLPSM